MSKLKAACAVCMAVAVLLGSACTSTKPHTVAMHVTPKAKKPAQAPDTSEESESDGPVYLAEPNVLRKNLPLAGTQWNWEGNLDQIRHDASEPADAYSVTFKFNGWFDFQADCRQGSGIYEITGQRIAFAVIKASHRRCGGTDSKADEFLEELEAAKMYRQDDGKLYIDLKHEPKTMVFGQKP